MNEESNKEVFQCICGKQFDNKKSFTAHKSRCKIYQIEQQKIKQQEKESRRLPNGMFKCENPKCEKEHDGSYWHKDTKDLDKKKDLLAKKYGFNTLRISDTEDIKKVYQNILIWYNINILNNKFNN